jgi:hypothetical protein
MPPSTPHDEDRADIVQAYVFFGPPPVSDPAAACTALAAYAVFAAVVARLETAKPSISHPSRALEDNMSTLAKALTGFAALAFVLAVVGSFTNVRIWAISPEAFSRASTNLALLAIALILTFEETSRAGRSGAL